MDLWDCSISLCSSCFASANGSPLSAESRRPLLFSKVFNAINVEKKPNPSKVVSWRQQEVTEGVAYSEDVTDLQLLTPAELQVIEVFVR